MSKSLGNTIAPQDMIKQSGAEVLRLWVASVDYREEMRISREILARVVEAYRKIRNTMRYFVANLYDFDPAVDAIRVARMEEVDRSSCSPATASWPERMLTAYDDYDYSTIFQALNAFATVDLSAFYSDISKDRLYTFAARSSERRSAQTAMYIIADGLTRLLAPILVVTADELWRHLPGPREESVHLAVFPDAAELDALVRRRARRRWTRLVALREQRAGRDRAAAQEQADRQLAPGQGRALRDRRAELAFLERYARDLPMLFIVSEVELRPAPPDDAAAREPAPRMAIERAGGMKCERCWRYVPVRLDRSGLGWPLRALPGRACGADSMRRERSSRDVAAADAPIERRRRDPVAAAGDRRARPGHEGARARDAAAPRQRDGHSRGAELHACPQHRRGVRHSQRGGLPVQGGRHRGHCDGRAGGGRSLYSASLAAHQVLARVGLALILGGAAGNLIDRRRRSARSSISSTSTGGRIISGHSTWRTRRLRSAWC